MMRRGEFAKIRHRPAMRRRVVPDEPRRGIRERIASVRLAAGGITPGPAGERALHIITGQGAVGPLMAVGAQNTAAVGVIQQGELGDKFVLVRGHARAEHAQVRAAVACLHVAEHLVISAVFLDEINHMLKHAGLAHPLGHGNGRLVRPRRQPGLRQQRVAQVGQRGLRAGFQGFFPRHGNERERAIILVRVVAAPLHLPGLFHHRRNALEVRHVNRLSPRIVYNRPREPAGRNQAEQFGFAGFEFENGDGILRAVANEESFAGRIKRQRIGLRSKRVARVLPRGKCFHHLIGPGVDDAERVAAGVGADQKPSVRRNRQSAGVTAGDDFHGRRGDIGRVDHGDRAFAGDGVFIHPHRSAGADGTGQTVASRTAAAPVAHVNFPVRQRHAERGDTHGPGAQQLAAGGVQLGDPVGDVERNV